MRITFFAVRLDLETGGGSHYTLDKKMRYLASQGYEIRLVTLYSAGNKGISLVPYQVEELEATGKSFGDLQRFVVEAMTEREKDAGVFHMDGPSFIWAGGKYRKAGGQVPTVALINNYQASMGYHKRSGVRDELYRLKRMIWEKTIGIRQVNYLDKVYFVSPVIRDIYLRWGIDRNITSVLPDFVEVKKPGTGEVHNPFGPGFNLLYAGRVSYNKGTDLLVRAMNKLHTHGVFLHIVGDGPQIPNLKRIVKTNGLDKAVEFHGWKDKAELDSFYTSADMFIHPVRWPEPFGRVVLEAMACGTPVITSEGTGAAWVVGESGLNFKNGSLSELIDRILELKDNPQLRKELAEKAKKRSLRFDYRNFVEDFENDLTALATGPGR